MEFEILEDITFLNKALVKVVGVGNGGCNAVQHMMRSGINVNGLCFICADTDAQTLGRRAGRKLQLGESLTKGAGTHGNPQMGREAALESVAAIKDALCDAHMVFVVVCMGGDTGTGAAPIIAEIARELGALTVGVATKSFHWEGEQRGKDAESSLAELKEYSDGLIHISNDRLLTFMPENATHAEMFKKADDILYFAVKGIAELIADNSLVGFDFADLHSIMCNAGVMRMGMGIASGEKRAAEATRRALSDPLLEDVSVNKAKFVLYNIAAHPEVITGDEVVEIGNTIGDAVHPEGCVGMNLVYDEKIGAKLRVTLIVSEAAAELGA